MADLQALSTPELKTLIRRNDDLQEEAVLELITRHDAGDLIEFLMTLKFQPVDVYTFLERARDLGVAWRTAGVAVGLSAGAARQKYRRALAARCRTSRIASKGLTRAYRIGCEVDASLLLQIDDYARELNLTRSAFIRQTIEEWIANHAA